jgi:hypothetical protein
VAIPAIMTRIAVLYKKFFLKPIPAIKPRPAVIHLVDILYTDENDPVGSFSYEASIVLMGNLFKKHKSLNAAIIREPNIEFQFLL